MYATRIGPVVYNPASRAFEALVTLIENRDETRIPCSLRMPITSAPDVVIQALVRQAKELRRLKRAPLTSRITTLASGTLRAA
jgi:hypothetical protein